MQNSTKIKTKRLGLEATIFALKSLRQPFFTKNSFKNATIKQILRKMHPFGV